MRRLHYLLALTLSFSSGIALLDSALSAAAESAEKIVSKRGAEVFGLFPLKSVATPSPKWHFKLRAARSSDAELDWAETIAVLAARTTPRSLSDLFCNSLILCVCHIAK